MYIPISICDSDIYVLYYRTFIYAQLKLYVTINHDDEYK